MASGRVCPRMRPQYSAEIAGRMPESQIVAGTIP
jgi:hypothetical protein